MRKSHIFLFVVTIFITVVLSSLPVKAISNNIIISQIKVGNSTTSRLIELYNNSNQPVDITNWCLKYSSPNNTQPFTSIGCFNTTNLSVRLFIEQKSFALLVSSQAGISADIIIDQGLGSGTSGHVYLFNGFGIEVDRIGWGASVNPESKAITLDATKIAERKKDIATGLFVDTDNNETDFFNSTLRSEYKYGAIYEVVDVCSNIAGIQTTPPDGYVVDSKGNCAPKALPLKITELLPNVVGDDGSNEYIEIYNPNSVDVDLSNYVLYIGGDYSHQYNFLPGSQIEPNGYIAIYNNDVKFTLLNTTSVVRLQSLDGYVVDDTQPYVDPTEGIAWAQINGTWQYTNQPTPKLANQPSMILNDEEVSTESNIQPCAPNQYRNPETNRCKLIKTSSTLTPCKDGQYRSEETNRCRSIATDASVLEPCPEGKERNPETNRCRSIASVLGANDLKPCKSGQERNPITNRCRNVTSNVPQADYAPEKTTEKTNDYILWLSLFGVGIIAISYGVWEWRHEIKQISIKIKSFLKKRK